MILVSILGDSISTFEDYNPDGYAVFYDKPNQKENMLGSVYDTWWAKVNQAFGAHLCVNNSYSGSRVSGGTFPSVSSRERLCNLRKERLSPDVILVYAGMNDFGRGVPVNHTDLNRLSEGDCLFFQNAYEHMITELMDQYPKSRIVCATLMRTRIKGNADWKFPETYAGTELEEYNEAIRKACRRTGCLLADLSELAIRYETLDGSHPTQTGHLEIAYAWTACLNKLNVFYPSVEFCIKHYHADENDDRATYMVFSSLYHERLLLPYFGESKLAALEIDNQVYIPIFTNYNRIGKDDPVMIQPVMLSDVIKVLWQTGKHLVINPFSEKICSSLFHMTELNCCLSQLESYRGFNFFSDCAKGHRIWCLSP